MKELDLRGLFTVALLTLVPAAAVAQVSTSDQSVAAVAPAGSPVAGYRMGGGDKLRMTIYGEPVPQLVELAKATHMEHHMKFFSFVKGLDSSR